MTISPKNHEDASACITSFFGLSVSVLVGLAFLCALLVTPAAISYVKQETVHYFETEISSTESGRAEVRFDTGTGGLSSPVIKKINKDERNRAFRFILPSGGVRNLQIQLFDSAARVTISTPQIITKGGKVVRKFAVADLRVEGALPVITRSQDSITVDVKADNNTSGLQLDLRPPFITKIKGLRLAVGIVGRFLLTYSGSVIALLVLRYIAGLHLFARLSAGLIRLISYLQKRPPSAIALVALLAVMLNCYPVIFLGRSFVSPNMGTVLLYENYPTLPAYTSSVMEGNQGSDVGAMIWQNVPYSSAQHEAIFHDHELPLWNRFNSCGVMLFTQGQSMFGDPLHLLPISANGASWAWDLKFVIAKWLFTCAMGLLAWEATHCYRSALLISLISPFIGVFLYRINHPAFFSFCYSPWILYSWLRFTSAPDLRLAVRWCGFLLCSCWIEMASGAVKEAYFLLIMMNFVGMLVLLFSSMPWSTKMVRLIIAVWTGVVFALIASPMWLTLVETLRNGYNDYENSQSVSQIHPALLLGLFDEIFYRYTGTQGNVVYPSGNFLMLLGLAYSIAFFRSPRQKSLKIALLVSSACLFVVAYKIVPAAWLGKVPYLAGIQATDSRFCLVLIVTIGTLAALGFSEMFALTSAGERKTLIVATIMVIAVVVVPYILASNNVFTQLQLHTSLETWLALAILSGAIVVFMFMVMRSVELRQWSLGRIVVIIVCVILVLVRFGQHARFDFLKEYVFHPAARVDFHAKSPAVEAVRADKMEPFRVIGIEGNFFAGWTGVYGLEGLSGPDGFSIREVRELLQACGLDRQWSWRIVAHGDTLDALRHSYDFAGVKYYFEYHSPDKLLSKSLDLFLKADLDVYMSRTVWPRAFFTDRLWIYENLPQLGNAIRYGDGAAFAAAQRNTLPSKAPSLETNLGGRIVENATDYHLTANSTSFRVVAPRPGVIVLQEPWIKDQFKVMLNGQPAQCLRINHAFKGVYVDRPGTYDVTFRYWPASLSLSLVLCAVGLALAFISWPWIRLYAKASRPLAS